MGFQNHLINYFIGWVPTRTILFKIISQNHIICTSRCVLCVNNLTEIINYNVYWLVINILDVPRKLNGTSSFIRFAREARPLRIWSITIITLWTHFLFKTQPPRVRSIRCRGPTTCCLVRYLRQKRSHFTTPCRNASYAPEPREPPCSLQECFVRVETFCRACVVFLVDEDWVVERSWD